jgi:hypothetical protein
VSSSTAARRSVGLPGADASAEAAMGLSSSGQQLAEQMAAQQRRRASSLHEYDPNVSAYRQLQRIGDACVATLTAMVPLGPGETAPAEEDLEVRVSLRHQYQSLHPLDENLALAYNLPLELRSMVVAVGAKAAGAGGRGSQLGGGSGGGMSSTLNSVHGLPAAAAAAAAGGAVVTVETGDAERGESSAYVLASGHLLQRKQIAPAGPPRGLDCVALQTGVGGPLLDAEMPRAHEPRLAWLRAKQADAEVFFGLK